MLHTERLLLVRRYIYNNRKIPSQTKEMAVRGFFVVLMLKAL